MLVDDTIPIWRMMWDQQKPKKNPERLIIYTQNHKLIICKTINTVNDVFKHRHFNQNDKRLKLVKESNGLGIYMLTRWRLLKSLNHTSNCYLFLFKTRSIHTHSPEHTTGNQMIIIWLLRMVILLTTILHKSNTI